MSWPRGSLFAALLTLALPQAFADSVIVNTTTDDNASNALCSLREAVEYFNQGKPEAGWQGCKRDGEASTNDSITLPADTASYVISGSAIDIRTDRNLAISGAGSTGDNVTRLQVNGAHRAFIIDDSPTYIAPACAATSSCEPAGAPLLDPASDTGSSPSDWLTPEASPIFTGVAPPPALAGYTVRVVLYAQAYGASEAKAVGSGLADTATNAWSVSPSTALEPGEYRITFATQQLDANGEKVGSESAQSPATTLHIYNEPKARTISFSGLDIKGCASTDCANPADDAQTYVLSNGLSYTRALTGTAGNGGIIFSSESVGLSNVALSGGAASANGGAIYVGGGTLLTVGSSTLSANKASGLGGAVYSAPDASVSVESSTLQQNEAPDGAALYAESNSLEILQSLLTENVVGSAAGAVVRVASATAAASSSITTTSLENTTVSGNTGLALSLRGGIVNTSTIVLNSEGGLNFNGTSVGVYNTILAGNHTLPGNPELPVAPYADCSGLPGTPEVVFSLVLSTGGCPTSGTGMQVISNAAGTDQQLMATLDADGLCNSPFGLLCPLSAGDEEESYLPFHLPRLLSSYVSLAESPIVNKGTGSVASTAGRACPSTDQRGESRGGSTTDYCDIGAVEVQAIANTIRSGDAISYYQSYIGSLSQNLGDEQLLAPSACPATAPVAGAIQYSPAVPGCPWLESLPPRGSVVFNTDGTYTYTPYAPFHGYDAFNFRVMTTLSHLNDEDALKGRPVLAQVIVQPAHGISHDSLGGASGGLVLVLLALLGMAHGRREQ